MAAATWGDVILVTTLPKAASNYTAEKYAIKQALDIADENPERNFIFSDSYRALRKMQSFQTEDGIIRGVQHYIHKQKASG